VKGLRSAAYDMMNYLDHADTIAEPCHAVARGLSKPAPSGPPPRIDHRADGSILYPPRYRDAPTTLDAELLCAGAMFHDMGLTPRYSNDTEVRGGRRECRARLPA
jgi:hypothetical protein